MKTYTAQKTPLKSKFRALLILSAAILAMVLTYSADAAAITYTWNQTTPAANNWNVSGNWSSTGGTFAGSAASDIVVFGGVGVGSTAGTVNNVVSANATIASLTYNLTTTSGAFHNTQIANGVTLTVSGAVTVGNGAATATTPITMSGTGNFTTTGTAAALNVGFGTSQTATLTLADGNNNITMGSVTLGGAASGVNGATATLNLGGGVNNIFSDTFTLGSVKASGTMRFAGTAAGSVSIANHTGTGRASILMANPSSGTGTSQGKMLFAGGTGAGHSVNVLASTVTMAKMGSDTSSSATAGVATLTMDNGTFDATSILIGVIGTDEANAAGLSGTITIGGNASSTATLIVNSPTGPGSGSFVIADATVATAGHTTATGTLNINQNGIAQIYCPITKAGTANNTATITVGSGGSLVMETLAATVGTTAIPINTLNLTGGALGASLHLNVSATSLTTPNISVGAVVASGTTTITIDSIANYTGGSVTMHLINYAGGSDPFSSLAAPVLPVGFTGTLVDNAGSIDLNITAGPIAVVPIPLTWNGGSGTDNNWSDLNNWNGTNLVANDTLFFAGSLGLNNTNDTTAATIYSNITFNAGSGAFVLNGNSITLRGNIVNSSSSQQTVNLGFTETVANMTLDGGTSGLIMGGGITANGGTNTLTLLGTGTISNSFGPVSGTAGLVLTPNGSGANWTILNNPAATAVTVAAGGVDITNGATLNFGSISSAPSLTFTGGWALDNILGNGTGTAALNINNGTLTLPVRLNSQNGNIAVVGGTLNVWNQLQGANGSPANVAAITVSGGTLNVASSGGTTAGGTFYMASRGQGTLTVTGSALVECSTLDVSRNAGGATGGSVGIVNLNGGTLQINGKVGTATANSVATIPGTATFNFNGGVLKANNNSGPVIFQGSIVAPIIPISAIVKSGGAVITTSSAKDLNMLEPLQHDAGLGGTADGGLTKNGAGVLTLNAGANTYTGNTTVSGGTLALTNSATIATSGRITVAASAILDASGRSDGTLTLASGQTLGGFGTLIGTVAVANGSFIAPGGSIGTLTTANEIWNSGGEYVFEIDDANGTAGTSPGWDSLNAGANSVDVQATSGSKFIVKLNSLNAGVAGAAANFNADNTYTWQIAASTSVLNFNANKFTVDTTGFVNDLKGGIFSVTTDAAGINLVFTPNHAPVAGVTALTRSPGETAKILISAVAANWSDADGDTASLVSVAINSTNGANNVSTDGTYIYYSPGVGGDVADIINYTINDGTRAAYRLGDTVRSAGGIINVSVVQDNNPTLNIVSLTTLGDGNKEISFAGIPGRQYRTQATDSMTPTIIWTDISTNTAPANGLWTVDDLDATNHVQRFYRSVQP